MSEAMTVETIPEAFWMLKGYWTKTRVPYKKDKGGWGDFDLIAYDPSSRHLVVAESKARGSARSVWMFGEAAHKSYPDITKWDDAGYFDFIKDLKYLWNDGVLFAFKGYEKTERIKRLTLQLVSNYLISKEVYDNAIDSVKKLLQKTKPQLPIPLKSIEIDLTTHIDIFCNILKLVRTHEQGRRYGHPVLDIARELLRYLQPKVKEAGRGASKEVQEMYRDKLLSALGLG